MKIYDVSVSIFLHFEAFSLYYTVSDCSLTYQRKSGAIEPEKDAEGNEINPHIPQYMASAPWYLNAQGPGLKHQKNYKDKTIAQVFRVESPNTHHILSYEFPLSNIRMDVGRVVKLGYSTQYSRFSFPTSNLHVDLHMRTTEHGLPKLVPHS
jgi:hypothetical protein